MSAPQTFGELVRAWRQARNLNRTEASKRLGVPVRTLEDWEYELHAPRGFARRVIEEKLRRRRRS